MLIGVYDGDAGRDRRPKRQRAQRGQHSTEASQLGFSTACQKNRTINASRATRSSTLSFRPTNVSPNAVLAAKNSVAPTALGLATGIGLLAM